MKAKYMMAALSMLVLGFSFTACSSDDDDMPTYPEVPQAAQKEQLTFDTDTVKVGVGETATFNVTNGNGDYKVINENPDVATATVNGSTVTVTSTQKGIAGVIVSDAKGSYKRILVQSMYFTMAVDKENVEVGMRLGHTDGEARVIVKAGNGGYKATSADEKVAKIEDIRGDSAVIIQGVGEGTTTVTITDMMGLSVKVNVTVKVTSEPYSDDEKQTILSITDQDFVWDGSDKGSWDDWFCSKNGDTYRFGFGYSWGSTVYSGSWLDYKGSLTAGTKGKGTVNNKDWSDTSSYENVDVEILKNDGKKVWGIMSVIKDNYLHYGYFVMPIPE